NPAETLVCFPQENVQLFEILREATLSYSLYQEDKYYHLLFRNLLKNFRYLSKSFQAESLKGCFQGIPAIICGAGPSLTQALPVLSECKEKALLIAGGSTITALSKNGILPHLSLAVDPNPEEYERLHPALS